MPKDIKAKYDVALSDACVEQLTKSFSYTYTMGIVDKEVRSAYDGILFKGAGQHLVDGVEWDCAKSWGARKDDKVAIISCDPGVDDYCLVTEIDLTTLETTDQFIKFNKPDSCVVVKTFPAKNVFQPNADPETSVPAKGKFVNGIAVMLGLEVFSEKGSDELYSKSWFYTSLGEIGTSCVLQDVLKK